MKKIIVLVTILFSALTVKADDGKIAVMSQEDFLQMLVQDTDLTQLDENRRNEYLWALAKDAANSFGGKTFTKLYRDDIQPIITREMAGSRAYYVVVLPSIEWADTGKAIAFEYQSQDSKTGEWITHRRMNEAAKAEVWEDNGQLKQISVQDYYGRDFTNESNYRDFRASLGNSKAFSAPNAEGIELYYFALSDSTATVYNYEHVKFCGEVIVPAQVQRGSKTYTVVAIDDDAFRNCPELLSVRLPENVEVIGGAAFSGCTALKNIALPASLYKIGMNAFENCTSLTDLTLPASLRKVGFNAFSGCTSLKDFTLPEGVEEFVEF